MLTDKIKHINPDIVIEENGIPTVVVPFSEYRNIALFLRNDPELSFDYLICMTGMDWGDSLYHQPTGIHHTRASYLLKNKYDRPGKPGTPLHKRYLGDSQLKRTGSIRLFRHTFHQPSGYASSFLT